MTSPPQGYKLIGTQANWHRCPPSPAGLVFVPCSTELLTGTAWGQNGGKGSTDTRLTFIAQTSHQQVPTIVSVMHTSCQHIKI